jgi:hypothetical protein
MSANPASANEINLKCSTAEGVQVCESAQISLRCSPPRSVPRQSYVLRPPALQALSALAPLDESGSGWARPRWVSNIAQGYSINLSNSTVNGEMLQIDQIDNQIYRKVLKLAWNKPADASIPAAHYVLDLRTGGIVVSFDNGESDDRNFASTAFQLRCFRPFRENS